MAVTFHRQNISRTRQRSWRER